MAGAPAFQFYARDFYAGTAQMSSAEVGAYIRALSWSWDNGPLPLDDQRRARVLMLSAKEFRSVWPVVAEKWDHTSSGFTNKRIEEERAKQEEFRAICAKNGSLGGRPRKPTQNPSHNPEETKGFPKQKAKPNPEESSSISDLQSAISNTQTADTEQRERAADAAPPQPPARSGAMGNSQTLISGRDQRRHGEHASPASCAIGACVHASQHSDFTRRLSVSNGQGPDGRTLREFYTDTINAVIAAGKPIGDRVFEFWDNQFAAWIGVTTSRPAHAGKDTAGVRLAKVGVDYLRGEGITARPERPLPTRPQRQIAGGE